ncbi:protein rIII [Escherichia phage APTC-EC-2A]|uniref:Uncharacterized protein n=2 Tax=Tequatrovirus TaxID=10663 RepID=A0A482GEM5_9CAUD|nr:hypothetical protein KMC10_gp209 [Escherichia phage vB_EcoM_G4498]QZI80382.1 hypothetical protein CHD2BS1_177 [Escherichia phage vB_EcoM-CHD2BS1]QZI80825.1 hypothetical protein CHD16UKE1_178 [Escherichia phage vB_EcoM-CHD16UKE1]QZI81564.1 hypothetical protein G3F6_177 [Escherichia phage vB_EcoM-G3F6]QZI82144.1 hypothetical protein G3F8_177 [Escherichia phage vB_EcoM-G3F8]QZI82434.1 hypothetical protein G3F9_177 [Escherichia phage vB_EcoM-G3F9]QZI83013.1 hypothetical protein G3G6_177 [Esche
MQQIRAIRYDDGFMVILVVKYQKTYVPLEGLRRQCQ